MATVGPVSPDKVSQDLSRVPEEDSGATTAANYHYQVEIIASFCACMPSESSLIEVICEWHEDFIIRRDDPAATLELVSVKHRERGEWSTLKSLCDGGGLAHLFDRWLSFSNTPRARLCSNAALGGSAGGNTPRALEEFCDGNMLPGVLPIELLTHLCWTFIAVAKSRGTMALIPQTSIAIPRDTSDGTKLPAGMLDTVSEFVGRLRFDCTRPSRVHITDVNVRQIVEPAMEKLGRAKAVAHHAYRQLVEIVAEANRDHSGRPLDLARHLADPHGATASVALRETIARRTLNRDQVLAAMRSGTDADSFTKRLLPSPQRPPRAAGGHSLVQKMSVAGIEEHDQANGLDLRDLWLHSWPQVTTGFADDVETEYRLELEIQETVRTVRHRMADAPEPFGPRFQAELHQALRAAGLAARAAVPLDDLHIIGYAYELSDRCKFGFTRPGAAP